MDEKGLTKSQSKRKSVFPKVGSIGVCQDQPQEAVTNLTTTTILPWLKAAWYE
jgi:hypothetical protein